MHHIAKVEEIHWRQKFRFLWIKQGDKNTNFFHKIANSNRRCNWIDKLEIDGDFTDDKNLIRNNILEFYKDLFSEKESWRPSWNCSELASISDQEKEWLERPFDEIEVTRVVKMVEGDKAPDPDGFNMCFFKRCWHIVKEDVLKTFEVFHREGEFVRSFNSTFIALMPKKKGAANIKEFRPISLLGSIYKLIAKVLTERMKLVINKLVSENQNAFLKGRQIADASLLANECIDYYWKRKLPGVVFKLDLEKAYDHVNWPCLLKLL